MPESKGRKRGRENPSPNTPQSSHSSQTAKEEKFCYKVLRLLGAILRGTLAWLRINITLKDVLTWISVMIGIAAGSFFFLPRVTVEPSGPYDPSSPSPITFVISNINIVPLRDVQLAVGLCSMGGPKAPHRTCNGPAYPKIVFTFWHVKWLDSDEKWQVPLEEAFSTGTPEQLQNADITIAVIYTPWRMPWFWRNTIEYRFVTKKLSDGKIYWIPTPLNR